MNYALDLLDAVAMERPDDVLPLVRQAAQSGQHLVVRRWLEDHDDGSTRNDAAFIDAIVQMTNAADRMGQGQGAGETFGQWARRAFEGDAVGMSELLARCVPTLQRWHERSETAARSLLDLGADPLTAIDVSGVEQPLAGTKVGLTQRNVTLAARAMGAPGAMGADFLGRVSTVGNPWPIVAEIGVGGRFHEVNAAGYALATGELRMLQAAIASIQGDERDVAQGLNHAIAFALDSGLVDRCTNEVHQGIAMCIARGADLDTGLVGQRMTQLKARLAEEVAGATDAKYTLPVLFMACPDDQVVVSAVSRLIRDYGMEINGSASDTAAAPGALHYAAASNRPALVRALLDLKADAEAVDSKGLTPLDWARSFDRKQALAVLTGQPLHDADSAPSRQTDAAAEVPMQHGDAGAQGQTPLDPDELPALSLEEFEAQGRADYTEDDLREAAEYSDRADADESAEAVEAAAHSACTARTARAALPSHATHAAHGERSASDAHGARGSRAGGADERSPLARDHVAPSVSQAQASRAATLFEQLLSGQAKDRDRAAAVSAKPNRSGQAPDKELATVGPGDPPEDPANPANPANLGKPAVARAGFRRRF